MSKIPKPQTKDDYFKEEMAKDKEGAAFQVMFAAVGMGGTLSRLPSYNDHFEVAQKAIRDIKNLDFTDMADYIDSLEQIAEHWQEYAEHYYDELKGLGYKFDKQGYIDEEPRTT